MDISAYLERVGYTGALEPSLANLTALQRAHLFNVPFENQHIHDKLPIVLTNEALFEKIVIRRRGGFCYELNGLFAWLLRELGYRVDLLSAGVARQSGGFGPEFDHLCLAVHLERPWLVDVGFGEFYLDPQPIDEGQPIIYRHGLPQYRFTTTPRRIEEFVERCLYHQTSPESSFTRERLATLAMPDGRVTLAGLRFIETRGAHRTETVVSSEEALSILRERFGL